MSEREEKEVRRGTVLLMTDNAVHSIEQLSIVVNERRGRMSNPINMRMYARVFTLVMNQFSYKMN